MHSITQTIAVENEISSITESFFSAFKLGSLLKQSGAYKAKGIPVLGIFRQLFELAFIHKKLFEALRAGGAVFAAKDTFYRFLNSVNINWTRFTLLLAERVVNGKLVPLTDEKRLNVFIVDDTVYERNRSKNVELLSWVYDHSRKVFVRGFRLLTLGWSDGNTFVPAGSCLLASADGDKRFQEARSVDKRSCGYRRRQLSQGTAPVAIIKLVRRALTPDLPKYYSRTSSHICSTECNPGE